MISLLCFFLYEHEEITKFCGFQPEMCSAIGTTKKEVAKAKDFIGKYVETEMGQEIGTIHAGDYLVILLTKLFIL